MPNGVATFTVGENTVKVALDSFTSANAISRLLNAAYKEGGLDMAQTIMHRVGRTMQKALDEWEEQK